MEWDRIVCLIEVGMVIGYGYINNLIKGVYTSNVLLHHWFSHDQPLKTWLRLSQNVITRKSVQNPADPAYFFIYANLQIP